MEHISVPSDKKNNITFKTEHNLQITSY